MAELSTVARPYAEAIFAVARQDAAGLAAWAEQVQQLADMRRLKTCVSQWPIRVWRMRSAQYIFESWSSQLHQRLQNFVTLLVANDRLLCCGQIAEQFHALRDEAEGVAQARHYKCLSNDRSSRSLILLNCLSRNLGSSSSPT